MAGEYCVFLARVNFKLAMNIERKIVTECLPSPNHRATKAIQIHKTTTYRHQRETNYLDSACFSHFIHLRLDVFSMETSFARNHILYNAQTNANALRFAKFSTLFHSQSITTSDCVHVGLCIGEKWPKTLNDRCIPFELYESNNTDHPLHISLLVWKRKG